MTLRSSLLLLMTVGAVSTFAVDPPRPTPESVRATINQLWSNDKDVAAKAVTTLEAEPLALPVLRRVLATDPNPRHQGDVERLIAKLVARQDGVTAKRVQRWADDGRLDLLTEVRSLTDGKAADAATDHLLHAAFGVAEVASRLNSPRPPVPATERSDPWVAWLGRKKSEVTAQFDTELTLPETFTRSEKALFADRIDMTCSDIRNSLVVCRARLTHLTTTQARLGRGQIGRCQWQRCVVFANTSVQVEELAASLLVVDGDVELVPGASVGGIIVANGSVREWEDNGWSSTYKAVVWATGDITLTPPAKPYDSLFFAGGKVTKAEKLAAKGCVEENVNEPPLPVRFLDPAELGLTLYATKEGMKVAKVADKSAFADAGLKAGDVIARVGEVATATAPAFRRELRRGVVEGAVLLDVIRSKEKVELLVAVPDVPSAPKKDKEPKAPPPEKK